MTNNVLELPEPNLEKVLIALQAKKVKVVKKAAVSKATKLSEPEAMKETSSSDNAA